MKLRRAARTMLGPQLLLALKKKSEETPQREEREHASELQNARDSDAHESDGDLESGTEIESDGVAL